MPATPSIAKVALHNFIPRNSDTRGYKLITEFMTYLLHWHFVLLILHFQNIAISSPSEKYKGLL